MAVKLADKPKLPRANVRNSANPFPADQYVKVPNVAIFSEHETKTPDGNPQRFDQHVLNRLIDRGNQRIESSGDYSAVCVGHTHDPDDPNGAEEQPEVIGAMGPYRLGLLGNPGSQQKYAILADLWIRRDKIKDYNANPRRSVELWYEHDKPAWIDPLSLLGAEAPRLDLGITPLIPEDAGDDGAELKYLYSASANGLRRVKYAAAFPSAGSVFVPAAGDKPKHYAAGGPADTQPEKEDLMLAPEDIRQICDAIEQLDVIAAMRDFMPMIPRVQELLTTEAAEHAAMQPGEPGAELPETGAEPVVPVVPETPATPESAAPVESGPDKLPEDLKKVPHSAEGAVASEKKDGTPSDHLKDMKEEDIERYLCQRNATKYSAMFGTVDGTPDKQPGEGDVDKVPAVTDGSADATQKAKYSMMENRLAELEADRVARINEARKQQLTTLRYHRAFDLDKAVVRCNYAKMSDADFQSHTAFIAESCTPTNANAPLPVPDALLDSSQPPPAMRQGPEKYTKDKADAAVRICYEKQQAGQSVSYEAVLTALVNGQPIPE